MKTWGIIGLGWLGSALATSLKESGTSVWGTHRADFNWENDAFPSNDCDVLLLNTPPLKNMSPLQFVEKIPVKPHQIVIFISSTSVYGNYEEDVTEMTVPKPSTESAAWLVKVETLLQQRFGEQLCIIRSGGLIGDKRHPVHHLAGGVEVGDGLSPINLIHRDDLIAILKAVAQLPAVPRILNAVTPYHPTRDEYYNTWAQKLGLLPIHFLQDKTVLKVVRSAILPIFYDTWIHPELQEL